MIKKGKNSSVHALIMEQIKDVENCLINFENFMRAADTPETVHETLRTLAAGVGRAEADADASLRRMIDSLSGGNFLPSTRQDFIDVATACDRVANKCESVSVMMVFQKFRFPSEYMEDLNKIIALTRAQFEVLEKSISRLFGSFGELLRDHAILDEIREYESKVDAIEKALLEKAFQRDDDLAHQIQLATFIEQVCDLSDIIENIADKIQIMLITRKA